MPSALTPPELGAAIAKARKALKKSQKAIADSIGIRQGTVSDIENGKDRAQIGQVLRLMAAVGLEFSIANTLAGTAADSRSGTKGAVFDEPFPDDSIDIDAIVAPRKRPAK